MKRLTSLKRLVWGVFATLFLLSGCKSDRMESYLTALPTDAMLIVSFNPSNLIEKADAKSLIQEGLKKLKTENNEIRNILESVLSDPAQSGLDPAQNQVAFIQTEKKMGMLFPVMDEEKVVALFQVMEKAGECKISEKDGFNLIDFSDEKSICIFNSSAMLVYHAEDLPAEEIQTLVMGYLKQPKAESLLADQTFDEFLKTDSDVNGWINMSRFPMGQLSGMPNYQDIYKDIYDFNDIRNAYHVAFNKGEIDVTTRMLFATEEARLKAETTSKRLMGKMDGVLLKYLPKNDWMCLGFNIQDGGFLYQMISNIEPLKKQMSESGNLIDYKALFSSIKGDFVIATAPSVPSTPLPLFNVLAQTTDNSIVSAINIAGTSGKMPIEMIATDNYKVSIPFAGISIQWGYCNGITYITNNPDLYSQLSGKSPLSKESLATMPQAALFKNNYAGAWMDFTTILQIYGSFLTKNVMAQLFILPVLSQIASYETFSASIFESEAKIKTTNPNENSLKQFVTAVTKMSNR